MPRVTSTAGFDGFSRVHESTLLSAQSRAYFRTCRTICTNAPPSGTSHPKFLAPAEGVAVFNADPALMDFVHQSSGHRTLSLLP